MPLGYHEARALDSARTEQPAPHVLVDAEPHVDDPHDHAHRADSPA